MKSEKTLCRLLTNSTPFRVRMAVESLSVPVRRIVGEDHLHSAENTVMDADEPENLSMSVDKATRRTVWWKKASPWWCVYIAVFDPDLIF